MWKHGKCMHLGPFSLGLAIGITSALGVLLWSLWVLKHGISPAVTQQISQMMIPTDMNDAWLNALWSLISGFVFGFFVAVFYDLFASCFGFSCRKYESCGCGPTCRCHGSSVDTRDMRRDSMEMRREMDERLR